MPLKQRNKTKSQVVEFKKIVIFFSYEIPVFSGEWRSRLIILTLQRSALFVKQTIRVKIAVQPGLVSHLIYFLFSYSCSSIVFFLGGYKTVPTCFYHSLSTILIQSSQLGVEGFCNTLIASLHEGKTLSTCVTLGYDIKQSDGDVPVYSRMCSYPSLSLLPGPLCPGVV